MAGDKKFYWIKLKDTFMTSDTVDFLMGQKNGASYVVLYQMLCLKTVNTKGELARKIGEIIIPYDAEKIQRDCKYFDIDTIRVALELYKQLGLIYKQEDSILKIANFENMVGSETAWAEKKRIYRDKSNRKLGSGQSTDNVLDNFRQEKEIRDKRLEKEIYKEKDKDTAPNGANTKNTLGSAFLGVEDENKETSFIATTALSNGQQQPSVAEKKETAKQQADNGTKASTTSGNLKTVKKITEAEIITYFAKTWEMYPRKVNKVQALKTYGYKLNGLSEEEAKKNANKIYATLKKQIEVWANEGEHGREFEFMPHFSTWLNANFTDSNGKARCR